MGLAKLCGFLATSVLLLVLLVDSTAEGCFPAPPEPCSFPVVIKGTYQNVQEEDRPSTFRITKVFKAPEKLGKKVKVSSHNSCYYYPEDVKVKEYIIVGYMGFKNIGCHTAYSINPDYPNLTEDFKDISNNGC